MTSDLLDGCIKTENGFIVQQTSEFVVDVTLMLFNWRVHVALADRYGSFYERGYCYFGTGPDTLVRAVLAAKQWEDPLHTDPVGFDKQAF